MGWFNQQPENRQIFSEISREKAEAFMVKRLAKLLQEHYGIAGLRSRVGTGKVGLVMGTK